MKVIANSQWEYIQQLRRLALQAKRDGECRYWREVNAIQYILAKRDFIRN